MVRSHVLFLAGKSWTGAEVTIEPLDVGDRDMCTRVLAMASELPLMHSDLRRFPRKPGPLLVSSASQSFLFKANTFL